MSEMNQSEDRDFLTALAIGAVVGIGAALLFRASDDFGATWTAPDRKNVRFPEGSDLALANVWQLRPGRDRRQ